LCRLVPSYQVALGISGCLILKNLVNCHLKKIILTAKEYPFSCCLKLKNEDGEYVNREWKNFLTTVNLIKLMNTNNWDNVKGF
jgi:hypothetical protein